MHNSLNVVAQLQQPLPLPLNHRHGDLQRHGGDRVEADAIEAD
jgi:hypothetical protein